MCNEIPMCNFSSSLYVISTENILIDLGSGSLLHIGTDRSITQMGVRRHNFRNSLEILPVVGIAMRHVGCT